MATYTSKKAYMYGTGRRKSSVARVHLFPNGTGSIIVNGRPLDDYFGLETLKLIVRQPFAATDTMGKFDVEATVTGGGVTGQAGAIRHGIARALLQVEDSYRAPLKAAGLLAFAALGGDGMRGSIRRVRPGMLVRAEVEGVIVLFGDLVVRFFRVRDFKTPKNPGNSTVSGVFLYPEFCMDWSVLMEFERKSMGLQWPNC